MTSSPQTSERVGAVKPDKAHDYTAYMVYCQDERNWFKRARGEWPPFSQFITSRVVVRMPQEEAEMYQRLAMARTRAIQAILPNLIRETNNGPRIS